MIGSGYLNSPCKRNVFFIQLFCVYIWIRFPLVLSRLVEERTNSANFGICRSSFIALPSIEVWVEQPSEQVCITQDPKALTEVCSQQEPYGNSRACIAVYYLRTYNIPLFAAFRMRATKERPLPATRVYREDCFQQSGGWRYQASSTDGRYKRRCNTQQDSWRFNFGVYDRGHLVPCGLGKQIGQAMGAATFNIFNAGPQLKEANKALETFEANLIDYVTGTCLKTDVITGNVVRDFISFLVPYQMLHPQQ